MRAIWTDETVFHAWAEAVGSASMPYGDFWRMALINPVILSVASFVAASEKYSDETMVSIRETFAEQRKFVRAQASGSTAERLKQWHADATKKVSLKGLHVLDLGCGEGYAGRWLSEAGAEYTGIDVSSKLLKEAKKRAGERRLRWILADLEGGREFSEKRLPANIGTDGTRCLALSIVTLDHLTNPAPLLKWLRKSIASSRGSAFLLVTLNWDFYDRFDQPPLFKEERLVNAPIKSANVEVDVVIRSPRRLEVLLRDHGWHVVDSGPLQFAPDITTDEQEEDVRGIPPFHFYLCRPVPMSHLRKETGEALARLLTGDIPGKLAEIEGADRDTIANALDRIELCDYAAGEPILPRNNLGGYLYVVVSGELALKIPTDDGERIARTFHAGEILGDLETAASPDKTSYYHYPVTAATDASLLRIDPGVVTQLIDHHKCAVGVLFSQLRDRLIADLWSFNVRSRNPPGMHDFDWADADRISRVLLRASEYERQTALRNGEGKGVFMDQRTLATEAGALRQDRSELMVTVRWLLALGIIDCFPGKNIRQLRGIWTDAFQDTWMTIVTAAAEQILKPRYPPGKSWETFVTGVCAADSLQHQLQQHGKKSLTRAGRELLDHVLRATPDVGTNEWRDAAREWLEYVCAVRAFWEEESPSFYYIHDLHALRNLVLGSPKANWNNIDLRREFRYSAAVRVESFQIQTRDAARDEPGRLHLYIRRAREFFLNDLANGHSMRFSGLSAGYDPPAENP